MPPCFMERAWPILVDCMCDPHYFLSYNELLLLCEVCQQNIMIFSVQGASLVYEGSSLGHPQSQVVLVALQDNASGREARKRTHFQRLVLSSAVHKVHAGTPQTGDGAVADTDEHNEHLGKFGSGVAQGMHTASWWHKGDDLSMAEGSVEKHLPVDAASSFDTSAEADKHTPCAPTNDTTARSESCKSIVMNNVGRTAIAFGVESSAGMEAQLPGQTLSCFPASGV